MKAPIKILFLAAMALSVVACGEKPPPLSDPGAGAYIASSEPKNERERSFRAYSMAFKEAARERGHELSLSNFWYRPYHEGANIGLDQSESKAAACAGGVVFARSKYLDQADSLNEQIVFHEFAHCVLGIKSHDTKIYGPLMAADLDLNDDSRADYKENRGVWLDQVFQP